MEGTLTQFDVLAVLPVIDGEDAVTSAERLLVGFESSHPNAGAVTSVDLGRGTFDVAFTVEASDAYEAIELAKTMFAESAEATDIVPRPLDGFHVEHVAETGEPVPA